MTRNENNNNNTVQVGRYISNILIFQHIYTHVWPEKIILIIIMCYQKVTNYVIYLLFMYHVTKVRLFFSITKSILNKQM